MGAAVSSSIGWLWYGSLRAPLGFWMDWIQVLCRLGRLQIGCAMYRGPKSGQGLLDYVMFQYESYVLLWSIEVNHLMETALDRRLGLGEEHGLKRALPHVDTSFHHKANNVGLFGWLFHEKKKKTTMMMSEKMVEPQPVGAEIVMIGGGHSHAFVIKSFGMNPERGVSVTLITDTVETPYSGMLPGHIAGHYTRSECHLDLQRLCQFGGVRLIIGHVYKIDTVNKLIYLKSEGTFARDRPPIHYDVLSIDIGSVPRMMNLHVFNARALVPTPVKPISQFSRKWDILLESIISSEAERLKIAIVGAGAGGVELTLCMQYRLEMEKKKAGKMYPKLKFVLVSNKDVVCPSHNEKVQDIFLRILMERDVEVLFNFEVATIEGKTLKSKNGVDSIVVDECVWCTNAKTQSWMGDAGLSVDDGGFVRVKDTLESENKRNIFAAGDCANMINYPRPKAGVFAVRQGPPLARNLRVAVRAILENRGAPRENEYEPYYPQESFLGIICTGGPYCVASRGAMALEGEWLWTLKDWIDRKWMAGYSLQLPVMLDDDDNNDKTILDSLRKASHMRCGGCGAKVGKTVLDRVVAQLHPPTRKEVLLGLDAPDDGAIVDFFPPKTDQEQQHQVVQTVDFFKSFMDDPFTFGQIAANHALSDCFAMCASPISAMAIAVVPFGSEQFVEGVLTQVMAGVCDILQSAECALVGGHTCEGNELSVGLAVSGRIEEGERPLTKTGVKEGDVLIMSKSIGTGVIFAASMRNVSKGVWVQQAIESMLVLNRDVALSARKWHATACTDITGFGLAGHLAEMMNDTDTLQAEIRLEDIPILPGAQECVEAGVFSSLAPDNRRIKHVMEIVNQQHPHKLPLLFDPQTSGGLLITIPQKYCQQFLLETNDQCQVIGRIIKNNNILDKKIKVV